MAFANRLLASFVGGTIASLLCAAALLRWAGGDPEDAMTAAGMLLMLVWPTMIVVSFVPERARTAWAMVIGVGLLSAMLGWAAP